MARLRLEKEARIAAEKKEKELQREKDRQAREERLAKEKAERQERLEAEKKARLERQEAEAKRKAEAAAKKEADRLARQAEQEKIKAEKEAEKIKKEEDRKEAKEKARLEQIEKAKERELLRGAGIQTKLNLGGGGVGVIKPGSFTLTQAEKEKLRNQVMMKAQFAAFKKYYPDLVEKNSIKYPIDDKLVAKMPELHGGIGLEKMPELKKVLMQPTDFENLIYIWEFFNNFADYLEITGFTLSEL